MNADLKGKTMTSGFTRKVELLFGFFALNIGVYPRPSLFHCRF